MRKACWTMTACPTPPFLPVVYTSADRSHYFAPGAFKFDKITQSLTLRRYCYLKNCVNGPFSLPTTPNHPYLPHRLQLFVGPTHSGFPHPQPLDPPRCWRLLRLDNVRGCEVRMWDNRSRIAISFEGEVFPWRCWPALRSRTNPSRALVFPSYLGLHNTSVLKMEASPSFSRHLHAHVVPSCEWDVHQTELGLSASQARFFRLFCLLRLILWQSGNRPTSDTWLISRGRARTMARWS